MSTSIQDIQSLADQLSARFAKETTLPGGVSAGEAKLLSFIAAREEPSARDIVDILGLDAGYVSRVISRFEKQGWLKRSPSRRDARAKVLSLTSKGRELAMALIHHDLAQSEQYRSQLSATQQALLSGALQTLAGVLRGDSSAPLIIRPLQPGDAGWIIHRHGTAIAQEFGWDIRFEAMVARILADFIDHYDPNSARSFIAERAGEILGSLFLIRENDTTARLRILYVEPHARGLGVAARLMEKATGFARKAGYKELILFTTSNLRHARRMYDKLGFTRISQQPNNDLGKEVMGEEWLLKL
jgi:DNA-binding MarR family transcriptional regulator/GNAT superfamily N-acetyltransferase